MFSFASLIDKILQFSVIKLPVLFLNKGGIFFWLGVSSADYFRIVNRGTGEIAADDYWIVDNLTL